MDRRCVSVCERLAQQAQRSALADTAALADADMHEGTDAAGFTPGGWAARTFDLPLDLGELHVSDTRDSTATGAG